MGLSRCFWHYRRGTVRLRPIASILGGSARGRNLFAFNGNAWTGFVVAYGVILALEYIRMVGRVIGDENIVTT